MVPLFRCLLLGVSLALCAFGLARADDGRKATPEELQRLQARIQSLNETIAAEASSKDALRQEVEAMEKQIADASEQVKAANALVNAQQGKLSETQQEQKRAQAGLSQQKQALAQQVRSAYLIGEGGQLRLLLNQSDAQQLDRMTTYYQYLQRARVSQIQAIQTQLDQITALEDRQAQQKAELEALRRQQQQNLNRLQASRKQREDAMQKIAQRIESDQSQVKQLQASEKEMQNLLRNLREALNDIPQEFDHGGTPFAKLRGKLPWPVRGKLLATFGEAKTGGRVNWNGYWIAAPAGAAVKAISNGRVAYVGWLHRYGLIIIVEHDDNYYTLYGHNESVNKTAGEAVKAGEVISHAGITGGYDQSGVYLEVRKGTEPLNPKLWLSK
jgi:septal ring factor EnvC (AmiA/AmiB activator)